MDDGGKMKDDRTDGLSSEQPARRGEPCCLEDGKHGSLFAPDCGASCGPNLLRLRRRAKGRKAPVLAHKRG